MLIGVHIPHGHQRAVFGLQRGGVMGQCLHTQRICFGRQQLAQRRIARKLEWHMADEMRQLVAGVQALEVRPAQHVIVGIDQPVRIKNHQRIHTQITAALTDFLEAVNRILARALARAIQLAQIDGRHMRDLGCQCKLSHNFSFAILTNERLRPRPKKLAQFKPRTTSKCLGRPRRPAAKAVVPSGGAIPIQC